jgi:hypothetical protein
MGGKKLDDLSDTPRRTELVQFRMEKSGYKFICDMAGELGMSPDQLCRDIVYKEITMAWMQAVNGHGIKPGITRRKAKDFVLQKHK